MDNADIFSVFDEILEENNSHTEHAVLAMPITPGKIFRRIKGILVKFLMNPKILEENGLALVKLPKIERKPRDSNYFYFFDKTTSVGVPTGDELKDFVFSVSELLGKEGWDEKDIKVQEARKVVDNFETNGWASVVKDSYGNLKEVKLANIKLLIRVADHDRIKLVFKRDDAERSGSKREIAEAKRNLDLFDARKSIVPKELYFDVDDTLETMPKYSKGKKWDRVIRDLKRNLHLLNKSGSRAVYDVSSISWLIRNAYTKKYTDKKKNEEGGSF